MVRATRFITLLGAAWLGGCGLLPGASGPSPTTSRGPDCATWEGPSAPSLLATSPELRARLRGLAERGAVAVRFERVGCELQVELLDTCAVEASYQFDFRPGPESHRRLVQPLEVLDAAPIGGLRWLPLLEKRGTLGVTQASLGSLRLPVPLRLPKEALAAEGCRGATHLVTGIELGRFRVIAGAAPEVDAALSGRARAAPSAIEVVAEVGDGEACTRAAREARPVIGCDEPLFIRLLAVGRAQSETSELSSMISVAAGPFTRGEDGADPDRGPSRTVHLEAFEIDRFEVSAGEYAACAAAGACAPTEAGPFCTSGVLGKERHPVNCIDYPRAAAYCAFVGKRLPTEAEWEKAARLPRGAVFDWGDEWPPPRGAGNFADETAARAFPYWSRIEGYVDGHAGTAPVDAFLSGALPQASGNVSEWVADFYDPSYYGKGPDRSPDGPKRGTHRVVRGGNFGGASPDELKLTRRDAREPQRASMYFGVRCARDAPRDGSSAAQGTLPEGDGPPPVKKR